VPPKPRRPARSADPAAILWAPWRYAYLVAARPRGRPRCIFCYRQLSLAGRRQRLILYGDAHALVMLNRYPYNNGHLMVAPRRHVADLALLSGAERAALDRLIVHAVAQLREVMRPAGFNIGANLGRVAGAGIADHLHWHIVPRWDGDTNFMPAIGATRVISQHLAQCFELLAPRFKAIETALS